MKTYVIINGRRVDLEAHLSRSRTIITLGRTSEEAYNVLALDDDSTHLFQCQFTRTDTGAWRVPQWAVAYGVSKGHPVAPSACLQYVHGQMCEPSSCSSYV